MPTAPRLRSLARAAPLALALCGPASPCLAHPHVWIAARSQIVFDRDHKLSAIRQTWTFDQVYSAFAVLGLDPHRDGRPDPDRLADLARTNLASLAEWKWFTGLKLNGAKVALSPPVEPSQTYADGRLTLSFLLPLTVPAAVKVMVLETQDPSFFVAFNLADDPDAVRLSDPPPGCAMTVHRPAKPAAEGVQILADAVAQTLAADVDASAVGADFTPRVLVACP